VLTHYQSDVIEATAMDDTMRRCILAMLLLTSGLPLMFAGPLLAAQPAAGALLEHQISGSCLQVQRGMRSAA
jgi:hypothetical protein